MFSSSSEESAIQKVENFETRHVQLIVKKL